MGKRELLLVFCFVIVGIVVYQATAKPPAPGERGLSLSRIIDSARREIRGNRAHFEETTTAHHALTAELTEVRLTGNIAEVTIAGEDRADVETAVHVESNGYDEAEAREYVKQSKLTADRAGSALIFRMEFPQGGRQRGTLKMTVPARLRVRIEPGTGSLSVSNVAGVEIAGTRGETTVRHVSGKVEVMHRGGEVEIEDVGTLDFTGRAGTVKVLGVRGDAAIRMEQGGEVEATRLNGSLEVEARNCDVQLEDLTTTKGPIRVNVNGGSLKMKGLKSETRVDGRNTEIEVAMAGAAPVAIYNTGERVTITPPAAGFTLDARVIDGRIVSRETMTSLGFSVPAESNGNEARIAGAYKSGGPTLTVRATNADFAMREPESPAKPDAPAKPDDKRK